MANSTASRASQSDVSGLVLPVDLYTEAVAARRFISLRMDVDPDNLFVNHHAPPLETLDDDDVVQLGTRLAALAATLIEPIAREPIAREPIATDIVIFKQQPQSLPQIKIPKSVQQPKILHRNSNPLNQKIRIAKCRLKCAETAFLKLELKRCQLVEILARQRQSLHEHQKLAIETARFNLQRCDTELSAVARKTKALKSELDALQKVAREVN